MGMFTACWVCSCGQSPDLEDRNPYQTIDGRDNGNPTDRFSLYRVKAPESWVRKNPEGESIADTTKPLCEFFIQENGEEIRITIHTFPSHKQEDRIPPGSQVLRWKRQFETLDSTLAQTLPISYNGYEGIFFEGSGILNGRLLTMMAWSMQLGTEHYQNMPNHPEIENPFSLAQWRASYSIKATGSPKLMESKRKEIMEFAKSFELIEEIPGRL